MIIKDERNQSFPPNYDAREGECSDLLVSYDHIVEFQDLIQNHLHIRDKRTHSQLQADLVEHLWHFQGRDPSSGGMIAEVGLDQFQFDLYQCKWEEPIVFRTERLSTRKIQEIKKIRITG
ncbi:putative nuclease HARBI1 [Cinnamomum micranthum f. kanehirae]|uniref:Putative nuclease HARBI1 n=1 Tax=Cinnamomum micranthum f. kanehirae TaxID=337451 RepID=A0A3S3PCX8_9MAGN|nr:putative nuclease HARBI1 [Cinnamomum micranthum f. kanehirae]